MKKLLIYICLILMLNIYGCGTKKGEKDIKVIHLSFWGVPEEVKIIKKLINKWEEKQVGIKVKLNHINYRGYSSKILTQIAGGAAPDIIMTEVDMFVNFVKKGVLHPLDEFILLDNGTEFNIKNFFPKVIDRFTVDEKLYCIPRDTAPFACVYYNKTLFDKMGVEYPNDNWDLKDLLEKSKKLTIYEDKGCNIRQYGFYAWAWQNFVYSSGGRIVDNVKNPTKCMLDEKQSIEGLQFYADLINKYKVMPTPVAMTNLGMGVHAMFTSGKLAMFCSGIWETPILRNKTKSMKEKGETFDWDIVMFPKGNTGKRAFGTGGSGYCITKSSRYKKEAWAVIKALAGDTGQKMLAETGLVQPANKKIATSIWIKDEGMPKNKKMLNKAVRYVNYNPFHTKWAQIDQLYIRPKLELLFNGKLTAEQAVEKFIHKANKKLKENE